MNESEFLASTTQDDLLWRQLKTIPAFRAILRAVEARFYFAVDLPQPTLDVGCGDGHFSQMVFNRKLEAGIDPWWNPLKKAQHSGMYDLPLQAMGDRLPFADDHFASAFSNSVLEHIPDDHKAMQQLWRVLRPGGLCLIQTPFKEGDIYEDETIATPADRLQHFGQDDHVRIYSVSGLTERLSATGFEITTNIYQESVDNRKGYKPYEVVLLARKPG